MAANNILGACAGLADFIKSANGLAGKKGLTKGEAAELVSEAEDIGARLRLLASRLHGAIGAARAAPTRVTA